MAEAASGQLWCNRAINPALAQRLGIGEAPGTFGKIGCAPIVTVGGMLMTGG